MTTKAQNVYLYSAPLLFISTFNAIKNVYKVHWLSCFTTLPLQIFHHNNKGLRLWLYRIRNILV